MTPAIASGATAPLQVGQLVDLALRGLDRMYLPDGQLFCHRIQLTSAGTERIGTSRRYTMICLLGLLRAGEAGIVHPFDVAGMLQGLMKDLSWLDNAGDLGLLVWLCAASGEGQLEQLQARIDLGEALERYKDVRTGRTMETAWLLTGLAHAGATSEKRRRELSGIAETSYRSLCRNRGRSGLFGHGARWKSLAGAIRGHIGSFADQVYPILALSQFARVFEREEAYAESVACARVICRRQGSQGQWWWHYDSNSGEVVERYPVYSVHQHGMGPMALIALQECDRGDFRRYIARGLAWLDRKNEPGQDMKDPARGVIWRNVHQRPAAKWMNRLQLREQLQTARRSEILHECWSYELGWLLYALGPELDR